MLTLHSLEERVDAVEESHSRHRNLMAEMQGSVHGVELKLQSINERLTTISWVAKVVGCGVWAIVLAMVTAICAKVIK